ncbi:DUF1269 domain-containing protein [Candidatus Methylomicrobium oryzae]|jgi:hypothetical protein|uniref:DUF1269 domain-containing protein n=1 Tax=Candidatus Methylomicrobium oryzae TaxID=2802053 RepID=UPI00192380D6|nr:DUF1269 domain-containing protein [Methylomicrobium sp. RS1]MBL1264855.1 DUF1269 domain-containing protein [Methylomicrobium sp. RS1]
MRRIYFLVPDIKTTHNIVNELHQEGFDDRHIHILAKRDTPLEDLPEATILEKTDFIPAVERGIVLGGTSGLLAGLIGLSYAGFVIAGGPLLGVILAGATIGSLAGGLTGMSTGNSKLKQFEEAIEKGELLVLLDIPTERITEITQKILKHHPNAEFDGIEPILPPTH